MNKTDKQEFPILEKISSPSDLKNIDNPEELCAEIRQKLIDVVSKNGGHLASNLGVVELTAALHTVFWEPYDRIIWDVGHQSYAHKMLTGRFGSIDTIRKENGLSGFTNRKESKYDVFTSGHSSTSISSALGYAQSKKIFDEPGHVVAVIGDGALTSGLAYEGLNNAGRLKKNFILVLNDNKMSISKNVGAVARYLAAARIRPSYMNVKNALDRILQKNRLGIKIKSFMKKLKNAVKKVIYKSSVFEDMGFAYYGPIDGHNFYELKKAFETAKSLNKPVAVHVITSKGKGYKFAEKKPGAYHGVPSFNALEGLKHHDGSNTFSCEFGKNICKIADEEPRICAITAAMSCGTCLEEFKNKYKSRFFDVGIAESHAVTFAGGLAAGGLIPVFAVYSSFLQRAYDQIIHDVSLQRLKVVLAVDRAGLVGEDGETHQGMFDVSFLNTIPDVTIFSPCFLCELKPMLDRAIFKCSGISAVRYPRGGELANFDEIKYTGKAFDIYGDSDCDTALISYGRIFANVYGAAKDLKSFGKFVQTIKLNMIKPIDVKMLDGILKCKNIIFFEESIKSGGVGEKLGCMLAERGFKGRYIIKAINDEFVKHASVQAQLKNYSLDKEGIISTVCNL